MIKFNSLVGQKRVKELILHSLIACKKQKRLFPNCLLSGWPGLGKTSLAHAIAGELDVDFAEVHGGNIEKVKQILPILVRQLKRPNSILFIDEVHSLPKQVQEFLYPAMITHEVRTAYGKLEVPPFTVIGATTNTGLLARPFYDRFVMHLNLDEYSDDELIEITNFHAGRIGVKLGQDVAINIARRAKQTPRLIVNYLELIRDYIVSEDMNVVSIESANRVFDLNGIDEQGLTLQDHKYLDFLRTNSPSGLKTISANLQLEEETIRHMEVYLLKQGLIMISPQGRQYIITKQELTDLQDEIDDMLSKV